MSKIVLITANCWEIFSEKFDTFEDAHTQMMRELEEELARSGAMKELAKIHTEGWKAIKDLDKYNGWGIGKGGFYFRKDCARCETDELLVWKIIEIQ